MFNLFVYSEGTKQSLSDKKFNTFQYSAVVMSFVLFCIVKVETSAKTCCVRTIGSMEFSDWTSVLVIYHLVFRYQFKLFSQMFFPGWGALNIKIVSSRESNEKGGACSKMTVAIEKQTWRQKSINYFTKYLIWKTPEKKTLIHITPQIPAIFFKFQQYHIAFL